MENLESHIRSMQNEIDRALIGFGGDLTAADIVEEIVFNYLRSEFRDTKEPTK